MKNEFYMNMALDLAKSTRGQTRPNPAVGAIVVNNNKIVGLGAHLKAGDAHAEINAIEMAKEATKGATLFVTLEPCSHVGKTKACADAIIKHEFKKVYIAALDPNEKVSGKGVKKLRDAGIEVEIGLLENKAKNINQHFFTSMLRKRPHITLKQATSLDGKIATSNGQSKWITSKEARVEVHKDRKLHDCILVGVNTVIKDNPKLTVRLSGNHRQPIRVVLDTHLRTPLSSNIITDERTQTWIFIGSHVKQTLIDKYNAHKDVEIFQLQSKEIELHDVLEILHSREIRSVYVEGGSQVNGSFLKASLIDEVFTYIAPKLIGGERAPTSFRGLGITNLADAVELEITNVKRIGTDIKIISKKVGS